MESAQEGRTSEANPAVSQETLLQTHTFSVCACHVSEEGTIIYKIVSIIKLAVASSQATFKGGLVTS